MVSQDYGGASHAKAGEIATQVVKLVKDRVKEGVRRVDVAEWVEEEIRVLGGQPAFPCSVAINEYAAHCAPVYGDDSVIPKNSIVKIDFGVHIDGYVCDCATTVNMNEDFASMEKATVSALRSALDCVKDGVTISELGYAIHAAIKRYNLNPIFNLTGHTITRYRVHSGISILNHENNVKTPLREGMVIAIEPFATNGKGYVSEHGEPGIFAIREMKNVRNQLGRKILTTIFAERKTLPFAERWLHKIDSSKFLLDTALRDMISSNVLQYYPPLRESSLGMVSQHECTVLVEKNGYAFIGGYEV